MFHRLVFTVGALATLLVLPPSTATAALQIAPACNAATCEQAVDVRWVDAREAYRQKQQFVGAIRQLSIVLSGRFGDEGRILRSSIDGLETALQRWDQAIVAFEAAVQ